MTLINETCAAIQPVDHAAARQTQQRLDAKTKPRGSLGVLEALACRLAAIYGHAAPALPKKAIILMAGDHGVVAEGVSAYPSEVTAQMLRNFASGGAAINVLARQARASVVVVNMGTTNTRGEGRGARGEEEGGIRNYALGSGTANMARGPAMTLAQACQGIETGIRVAADVCAAGDSIIGVGEMGIGNTTAASALTAVFTGEPPARVTGWGTGIDDTAWQRKIAVIERALAVNEPSRTRPLEALAQVGGFELAGLVGVMLGAAAKQAPIMLDGFITGAAALVAVALCPQVRDYLIASHQSVEPGHRLILEHLELRPLLNLDLRLGEGTGAALALHLVDASLRIVAEMATFTSAGVTNTGARMHIDAAIALAILGFALLIDCVLGEYPTPWHPVVWLGRAISACLRLAPASGPRRQLFFGASLTVLTVVLSAGLTWLIMWSVALHPVFEILLGGLLLKATFALRALGQAAKQVIRPLAHGDLAGARLALRSLCSRDPSALTSDEILVAVTESLAENASDSFVAPLFFYVLLGVPGAAAYRAINTLDAMIGYRGKYEYLGKCAARVDDLANLVPARLTALLFLATGWLVHGNVAQGWRMLRRDGAKTPSPNGGRPMAAMAGLLGVRLDKKGSYSLGEAKTPVTNRKVKQAWHIVVVSAIVMSGVCAGVLWAVWKP